MDTLVHWFLAEIFSPLLLPLFLVATLAVIFGLKPEFLISALLEITSALFIATLKTVEWITLTLYQVWRHWREQKGEKVPLPPKRRQRPGAGSDQHRRSDTWRY